MAVAKVSDLSLGSILKIVSKNGVANNLSEDSAIWQNILKQHVEGDSKGRELRYLIRTAYGSGAGGFLSPDNGAYKSGSQSTISEGTAQWKDYGTTIEVEETLVQKAARDFDSYGRPLVDELDLKVIALSRTLSAAAYADGTGVIAQALDAGSVSSAKTVFNIDPATGARGFVGWLEEGDIVMSVNADGTDAHPTLSSGTFSHYTIDSVDRDNDTVTLQARNTAGTALDITATGITAGDYLVRGKTADTFQDLSSIGSTDYNTLSHAFTGLDSLSENDSRVVNGITLSGNAGGTRQDESGNPIDSQAFQKLMSKLMRRAGKGRYKYDQALMAFETYDSLIESRETDRRFMSVQDDKRGAPGMAYVHMRNNVMFDPDEFCHKKRIYCIPDKGVLQFHGTDFDFVQPNGADKFHLRPTGTSAGYDRVVQAFMTGSGALITTHAAGIGCIENFT
jgi:hypothetical protein